jgi:hypothetical protein
MMTPGQRKLALTAHITSSVGWLGAVAAFLALAIAGLGTADSQSARAAYVALEPLTMFVIVPLSIASLLTGLVESLGTRWGLFRHYWVVVKLFLNVVATAILLMHTKPIQHMAGAAAATMTLTPNDFVKLRVQLVADAGAATLVLLLATTLAVYKPKGLTPYGQRKNGTTRVSA